MKKRLYFSLLAILLALLTIIPVNATTAGDVLVLDVEGVINPFSTRYLARGLNQAEQQGVQLVVITLNTPGGLETAMRDMVSAILDSPVPVAVFVTPEGARATSAGLFLVMAADIAAMSPATHLGAASPVALTGEMDEVMNDKALSDASALVRSLAEKHERNANWAEDAVRESLSLTANEALSEGVIDFVATDLQNLFEQIDGQQVKGRRLDLNAVSTQVEEMNWVENFFHVITEPNIAYLLLSLGTIFLLAELADPGLSLAGVGAALSFVIGFMALGSLPINWAAIALLVLSVIMFAVALLTDTEIVVTVAGLVPFILGSMLLFTPFQPASPVIPPLRVSWWLILLMAGLIVFFSLVVLRAILSASRQPPQMGAERFIDQEAQAQTDLSPIGQVRIDHQDWSAICKDGTAQRGQTVRVVGVEGVRLVVQAEQEKQQKQEIIENNQNLTEE